MSGSATCPGDVLAALVDGELDHGARERVLRHLTGCATCRAEVEAQRRLKASLSSASAGGPAPSDALLARLQGLAVPGVEPLARPARSPLAGPPLPRDAERPGRPRPVSVRPAAGPAGARPGRVRRTRRAATVGSCVAVVGLCAALALGGTPASDGSTPVDPAGDTFVADFVSTRTEVPFADPAVGTASLSPR